MSLALVVAAARNGVIGRDNDLPWHLRADLQHFKRLTLDAPIIMGRQTWESIGRPLPRRRSIVVTRQPDYRAEGAETVATPAAAVALAGEGPAYVIGGAQLYAAMLPQADCIYLTEVDAEPEGDAWFHLPDPQAWQRELLAEQAADADNDHPFRIWRLTRDTPR